MCILTRSFSAEQLVEPPLRAEATKSFRALNRYTAPRSAAPIAAAVDPGSANVGGAHSLDRPVQLVHLRNTIHL